ALDRVDTVYFYITTDRDTLRIDSTFVAMLSMVVRKRLIVQDSLWIGTFEGSTFGDLNIKQTTPGGIAIRIEEASGQEAYGVGVSAQGDFALHDDDGSLVFWVRDGTNQVIVEDSILVKETSRFGGDAKFESDILVEGSVQEGLTVISADDVDTVNIPADVKYAEGLNLDLEYYFNRNVVQFMAASRDVSGTAYTNWGNKMWSEGALGTHTDDASTYLTDAQAIKFTSQDPGVNLDGIYLDFADIDLTTFPDGSASTTADYICIAVNITTQDIADLPNSNGLYIAFPCDAFNTWTNYFSKSFDDSALLNGWNYLTAAKSTFTPQGSPNWNAVKGFTLFLGGASDGEVVLTIDNLQMVRDDPDEAEPNPFQHEKNDGEWVRDWNSSNGNVTIVEETGVLSAHALDFTANITSLRTWGTYWFISGQIVPRSGAYGDMQVKQGASIQFTANQAANTVYIVGGSTAAFTHSVGDLVWFELERKGQSVTGRASLDGVNYTQVYHTMDMTTGTLSLVINGGLRAFNISTVNQHVAQADRLTNVGIRYEEQAGLGTWMITQGDSTWFFAADSVTEAR
ncbi:hypothetical protein LCGC14_1583640, partial [marine sediment metagenome]